jgi:hypothetical protein
MSVTIILEPVDWSVGPPEVDYPYYRQCDLCYESAVADIHNDKGIEGFRQFVRVIGGDDNGLIVCEHCLEAFLKEQTS